MKKISLFFDQESEKITHILFFLFFVIISIIYFYFQNTNDTHLLDRYDNLHWTLGCIGATFFTWLAFFKNRNSEDAISRKYFFYGFLSYLTGQILWDVQFLLEFKEFPAPSDIFYLGQGPLIISGIVIALKKRVTRIRYLTFLLDLVGYSIALLLLIVVWYFPKKGDFTFLQVFLLVAYPASLFTLFSVAFISVFLIRIQINVYYSLFLISIFGNACLWLIWNLQVLGNHTSSGSLLNWLFSVFILASGYFLSHWKLEFSENKKWKRICGVLLGSLPIVTSIIVIFALAFAWTSILPESIQYLSSFCGVCVILVSLTRQYYYISQLEEIDIFEKRVIEKEEKFKLIFNFSPVAMIISNLENGKITAINNTFTEKFGYTFADLQNLKLYELDFWANKKDKELFSKNLDKQQNKNAVQAFVKRKDGNQFFAIVSGDVFLLEGISYLTQSFTDISDQKNTELELKDSRNILETLSKVQIRFIKDNETYEVFRDLLSQAMELSKSKTGMIAELSGMDPNNPELICYSFQEVGPDGKIHENIDLISKDILELTDKVIQKKSILMGRTDTDWNKNSPYLALPFFNRSELVGLVVLMDREAEYDPEILNFIEPFMVTCTSIIAANRIFNERDIAIRELKDIENKFKTICRSSHAIIFILDKDGKFILSEGMGLKVLGLEPGQVIGLSALELYKDVESITEGIKSALRGEICQVTSQVGPLTFSAVYSPLKNENGEILGIVGVALDISEKVQAIDALKESEENYKKLNEELESKVKTRTKELEEANNSLQELNKNLVQTVKELEETQSQLVQSEKLAVLGQLAANIAHEVNTPLGAIVSSNEIIYKSLLESWKDQLLEFETFDKDDRILWDIFFLKGKSHTNFFDSSILRKRRKNIQQILEDNKLYNPEKNSDLLVDLGYSEEEIKQLIPEFTKSKNFSKVVDNASFVCSIIRSSLLIRDASTKATRVIKALKTYSYKEKEESLKAINLNEQINAILTLYYAKYRGKVQFGINIDPELYVSGNPDELSQVWINLINNGLQAMSFEGNFEVLGIKSEKKIEIRFIDSGSGIPESIQSKIFEPFFTTKKADAGTGLGLDICKRIIEKHNGEITFKTRQGLTTFTIFLPEGENPFYKKIP